MPRLTRREADFRPHAGNECLGLDISNSNDVVIGQLATEIRIGYHEATKEDRFAVLTLEPRLFGTLWRILKERN